ncbi:MAG TPA: hypothetical protein PLH25_07420 [Flavobacterium sp.]|nr:hypothetical protein [Flavobacterium sp.]
MKKIINIKSITIAFLSSVVLFSCDNNDDATGYSNLIVTEGVVASISLSSPLQTSQTVREADEDSFSYTITLDKTQAVDIHITVSQIDGDANADSDHPDFEFDHVLVIPAYTTSVTGTIKILNDTESEDDETVTLKLGGTNTSNASLNPVTVSFTIEDCFSDLAGTYTYSTTNCSAPTGETAAGPITGSVTFEETEPGKYELSDASFGGWIGLYGSGVATGVSFLDLCGQLSFTGVDQYNETFFITNLVIDGANMSFHWENDYGEFGDTTLTRTDGTNWPQLSL